MLVLEFKVKGKVQQYSAIDDAIRTFQFVRNKALRFWMDNEKVNGFDLNQYCAVLAKEFDFAKELNSQARQAAAERAWFAISRFFDNCKSGTPGKKATLNSRKTTVLLNIKRQDGCSQKIVGTSLLVIKSALGGLRCWVLVTSASTLLSKSSGYVWSKGQMGSLCNSQSK